MISVVVATYNGEKYIQEQLESIRTQIRPVDEVLICDDCSTDTTREICQDFIEQHDLKDWRVVKNQYNLGYYQNFMNGLRILHGDILVLCDQDDIWCPNKIQIIEETMRSNPKILSLTTTFSRFDNAGNILDKHVRHPHSRSHGLVQLKEKNFFTFHAYLGMSMAIRKSLLDKIVTTNNNNITHDIVINMYAVHDHGLYHLDRVLTKRRSYETSTSNDRISRELEEKYHGNKQLQYLSRKIELLNPNQFCFEDDAFTDTMKRFKKNYQTRYDYIAQKDVLAWLKNFKNIKLYEDYRRYFKDFLAVIK